MTQSHTHTPGPWKYGCESVEPEWFIVTDKGGGIVANVNTETGPDASSAPAMRKMPGEANARLIAAAPELLAALKLVTTALDVNDPDHERMLTNRCSAGAAIREARAAIAKAEGRS